MWAILLKLTHVSDGVWLNKEKIITEKAKAQWRWLKSWGLYYVVYSSHFTIQQVFQVSYLIILFIFILENEYY